MSSADYTYSSPYDFATEKARLLRMAEVLGASGSAQDFRSRLLTATDAPWHSYDLLALVSSVAQIGEGLSDLISVDLDEEGVPR